MMLKKVFVILAGLIFVNAYAVRANNQVMNDTIMQNATTQNQTSKHQQIKNPTRQGKHVTKPTTNTNITGDTFLKANSKKPGVVTLPDGLQYKVLVKGTGPKPKANDIVVVHYAGSLITGQEFDSSYKRGQPATFPVNGVIPGWVEALQMMPVGSTWELYIPAKLAYGETGAPPIIGPNQVLVFKVNLIDIKNV